jgi:hypothetical protein
MADLHDLIRQLGEPDKAAQAFQAPRDMGTPAVEPLLAALGSPPLFWPLPGIPAPCPH